MITALDDYLAHQTSEPIAQPATSDRNFYDRCWFNGFDAEGEFVFEVGFGVYPNRRVMDAHFSVVTRGRQHCLHVSRRAPRERSETQVGPLRIDVIEPLRIIRVRVHPNRTGVECDLTFHARSAPTQEPKNVMHDDGRLIMDTSRFTQLGSWGGHFAVEGTRRDLSHTEIYATRDRSWGVRPVGEPEAGAPGKLTTEPGVYWVWAPVFFESFCTQFQTFEDRDGNPTQVGGAVVPLFSSPEEIPPGEEAGREEVRSAGHRIEWRKGTRLAERAEIELITSDETVHSIRLEPMLRFHLLGIGYQHPEWGHGFWKGEEVVEGESWDLDALDLLDYKHIHTHQICRARMGEKVGIGTLETVVFGRHAPSGFESILDGAP
jgi:hypothetical protein